jgi:acyl carrier protein
MRPEAEVRASIRAIIFELAPTKDKPLNGNPRMVEDLEYHSLAMLELAFVLEDEFELPPLDAETVNDTIRTVSDVEDYVLELMRTSSSARDA